MLPEVFLIFADGNINLGGEHYFLEVSATDSIKWNVPAVAKKMKDWKMLGV